MDDWTHPQFPPSPPHLPSPQLDQPSHLLTSPPLPNNDSLTLAHFHRLTETQEQESLSNGLDSVRLGLATPDPSTKVVQISLYPTHNGRAHHTDAFSIVAEKQVSVWRRGQTVLLSVRTQQLWQPKTHSLKLVLDMGRGASVPEGSRVVLELLPDSHIDLSDTGVWAIQMQQQQGQVMVLELLISSSAPIGAYTFAIETSLRSQPHVIERQTLRDPVYVLFNPYCPDDPVYMAREDQLAEYLLNDTGKIFIGTHRSIRSRDWVFGQFEEPVLFASLFLLERARMPYHARSDPVQVSRAVSAMVNHLDDWGVLEGSWSGRYQDGTAPTDWQGSARVLEQYMSSGGRPVKYGQCWVFAGVVTSVCRALGLPCRPVTNFSSAHDTNASLTIDRYYSASGSRLETVSVAGHGANDSIWNFHVWNDVFMSRADLPRGYGGWQAIDATPQEKSNRKFQCGPASVAAIKMGMIGLAHDVGFVFSEVNSDIVHFTEDPNSSWGFTRTNGNSYHVGRRIVTKAVGHHDLIGQTDAEDITPLYKMTERDSAERIALMNAVRRNDRARTIYSYRSQGEVTMQLQEIGQVKFGDGFTSRLEVENKSENVRTLETIISCSSLYYNGVPAHRIKVARGRFSLKGREKDSVSLVMKAEEYLGRVVEYCHLKVTCLLRVVETGETWSGEEDFLLDKPRLSVSLEGEAFRRRQATVRVTFRNPLKEELTQCYFLFEASGVVREGRQPFRDVGPGEEVSTVLTILPRRAGSTLLLVRFNSAEMVDVNGSLAIRILP